MRRAVPAMSRTEPRRAEPEGDAILAFELTYFPHLVPPT